MQISERLYNQFEGTITAASGTLSSVVDLGAYDRYGLLVTSPMLTGSLTFAVATDPTGPFVDLVNADSSAVAVTGASGTFAVSATVLQPLAPYRYVRLKATSQTNGLSFVFVAQS